jgi:tRNA (guanine37-N1)-methyltransferase
MRKKEYPQYSRPEIFEDISVPQVLLSGDQKKIKQWKEQNLRN